MKKNILKFWYFLLGVIPFSFVISLIIFYFHSRQILGRFPFYDYPDPKELHIYIFYSPFINFFAICWIYSLLLWLSTLILNKIIDDKNIPSNFIIFGLVSFVISIIIFFSPILEWYMD